MGAEVIKVEVPPHGDPMRASQPRRDRRSGGFIQQNRGKKSLCIETSTEEGRAVVMELLPTVDIVVENFSPGVMARRGLDFASLSAVNPRLVMVSVSGFGQTGPLSPLQSYDFIAQAYSGMMHMTGDPGGPPMFAGIGVGDTNAGVHAWGAIGYALLQRERTGRGSHVDVAMLDSLFHMQEMGVQGPTISDGEYVPMRQGRSYQPMSPAGSFKGPQGWIVILCAQGQVGNLFAAMGRPELLHDDRFRTNQGRLEHRDELTALIEEWMATFSTDAEVVEVLQRARVPTGPVLSPADSIHQEAFLERGTVRWIEDPQAGALAIPGFPVRFGDPAPEGADLVAPRLGEHNRAVLGELLGYDDDRLADLAARGIIAEKDR
jgi:crotonobetainyl-CoA:carnitine CoA-transferase CaiB-like acyl-CoA transferase